MQASSQISRPYWLLAMAALMVAAAPPDEPAPPAPPDDMPVDVLTPWERMNVAPGAPLEIRPQPPREGRNACIRIDTIAGAQLFGDAAIELTMKDGKHWRMFFAQECPALSFYQGFYYRRGKANMLCAGRDAIGARSGGECRIASIIPVRIVRNPSPRP